MYCSSSSSSSGDQQAEEKQQEQPLMFVKAWDSDDVRLAAWFCVFVDEILKSTLAVKSTIYTFKF
jgi:hypothetical protein